MTDARALEARAHHEASLRADAEAAEHRLRRNELVKALRADDPKRWTYPALADAVGIDRETVRAIVDGRLPRGRE